MSPPVNSGTQSSRRIQRHNSSSRRMSSRQGRGRSVTHNAPLGRSLHRHATTVAAPASRRSTRSMSGVSASDPTSDAVLSPPNIQQRTIRTRRSSTLALSQYSQRAGPSHSGDGAANDDSANLDMSGPSHQPQSQPRKRRPSCGESVPHPESVLSDKPNDDSNANPIPLPRKRSRIQLAERSSDDFDATVSDDSSDDTMDPLQSSIGASRYPLRSLVRRQERRDLLERHSSFQGRSLDTLPFEVCQHIFQYLSIKDLYRIRMLCSRLQVSVDSHLWTLKRINFCNGLPFLYLPDQITDRVLREILRRSPHVTHILGFYPRYIGHLNMSTSGAVCPASPLHISNTDLTYQGVFNIFRQLSKLRSIEIMDISILSKVGTQMPQVKFHGMFRNRPDLWDQQLVYTPYIHFTDGSLADTGRSAITSQQFVTITPPAQPLAPTTLTFSTMNAPFGGNNPDLYRTARMSTGGRPRLHMGGSGLTGYPLSRFVMPNSLLNVTKLEFVSTCLSSLPRMDSLKYLSLRCVRFTSTTPFNNLQMPKLQTFIMNNCTVGNRNARHLRILPELARASQLTRMEVSSCRLLVSLMETMITDNAQHLGFTPFSRLTRLVLAGLWDISPREVGLMLLAGQQTLQHVALEAPCLTNAELLALANAHVQLGKLEYLCLGYEDPLRQRLSQRELKQLELTNNSIMTHDLNLQYDRNYPFPMRLCCPPPQGSPGDPRNPPPTDQLNGLLTLPQQPNNIGNALAAVVQHIHQNNPGGGEEPVGNPWGAYRAVQHGPMLAIPPRTRTWNHSTVPTTHPTGLLSDVGVSAILLVSPQLQTLHVCNQPFLRHIPMWHPRYAHRLRGRPAPHNRVSVSTSQEASSTSGGANLPMGFVAADSTYACDLRRDWLLDDMWGTTSSYHVTHMLPENIGNGDYSLPRCLRELSGKHEASGAAKAFPLIRTLILERCPGINLTSLETVFAHELMPQLETVVLREMFASRPLVEKTFSPPSLHTVFLSTSTNNTKVASDTHNGTVRPPTSFTFDMGIEDRAYGGVTAPARCERVLQDARLHQVDVWRQPHPLGRTQISMGVHRPGWHELAEGLNDVRYELLRWRPEYCQMPLIPCGNNPPMGNLWDTREEESAFAPHFSMMHPTFINPVPLRPPPTEATASAATSASSCSTSSECTTTNGHTDIPSVPDLMTVGRGEYRFSMQQQNVLIPGYSNGGLEFYYNSTWGHYRHPTREMLAYRAVAEALKRAAADASVRNANITTTRGSSTTAQAGCVPSTVGSHSHDTLGTASSSSSSGTASSPSLPYMYCDFQSRATQTCLCNVNKRDAPFVKDRDAFTCHLCRSDNSPSLVNVFQGYPEPLIVPQRFEKDVTVRDASVDTRERPLHTMVPMYQPLHVLRAANLTTLHLEHVGITHLWLEHLPKLRNLTLLSCPQLQSVMPEFVDMSGVSGDASGLMGAPRVASGWPWKDDSDLAFPLMDMSNPNVTGMPPSGITPHACQRLELSTVFWPNLRRVRIMRCPKFAIRQLLHLLTRMRYERKENIFITFRPFGHYDKFTEDVLWLNMHMQAACNMNLCISHDYARHLSERQMESRRTRVEAHLREAIGFDDRHQNSTTGLGVTGLHSSVHGSFMPPTGSVSGVASQMRISSGIFAGGMSTSTGTVLPVVPPSLLGDQATPESLLLSGHRMADFPPLTEDPFFCGGPWMRLSNASDPLQHLVDSGDHLAAGSATGLVDFSAGLYMSSHAAGTPSTSLGDNFTARSGAAPGNSNTIGGGPITRRTFSESVHLGSNPTYLSTGSGNTGRYVFSPPFLSGSMPPMFPPLSGAATSAVHACFNPVGSLGTPSSAYLCPPPCRMRPGLHKMAGTDWEITHEVNWPSGSLAEDLNSHAGNIMNHSVADSGSVDYTVEDNEQQSATTRKNVDNSKLGENDYLYFLDNLCSDTTVDTPVHHSNFPTASSIFSRARILHLHVQWRDVHPVDYLSHPYQPLTASSVRVNSASSTTSNCAEHDLLNEPNARHVDEAYLIPPLQQSSPFLNSAILRALRGNRWLLERMAERVRRTQDAVCQWQERKRFLLQQRQSEEQQRLQAWAGRRAGRDARRSVASAALIATIARVKMEGVADDGPDGREITTEGMVVEGEGSVNGGGADCLPREFDLLNPGLVEGAGSANGVGGDAVATTGHLHNLPVGASGVVVGGGADLLPGVHPPAAVSPRFNNLPGGVHDGAVVAPGGGPGAAGGGPGVVVAGAGLLVVDSPEDEDENSQSSSRSPSECQVEFSHNGIGMDENTNF